jgi:hypothetical protein
VLSVDQGGVADRVRLSGAGALYALGDPVACVEAAVALLRSDLRALGDVARSCTERHHSWRAAFDGIFRTYRTLLAQGE